MSTQFRPVSFRRQLMLETRAQQMRLAPSEPERRLWEQFRSSKLGVQFRRQVVVAGCIVDFFAPSARLVVEVDGAHHRLRRMADARRDERLGVMGLRVLRVPAQLVLQDLEAAVRVVTGALAAQV